MTEFLDRSLMDVVSFIVDNRGRTCPVVESGFPLIATNCVVGGRRDVVFQNNVRYVDVETFATWFRAHPEPGDVLLVCKGNAGRVAVVPNPVPYCIAQDMVALRANRRVVDPLYLYYRLVSRDVQERIADMHVGSLIPHFKKGDFKNLRFSIHADLGEQRRIAALLGALDDLIETNRGLAGHLHDAARAVGLLMLDRFADRPDVPLPEVAVISKGFSYKSGELTPGADTLVNLKNFGRGGVFQHHGFKPLTSDRFKPGQVVEPGDVVISMTDLTQQREVIARPVRVPNVQVEGKMVASLDLAIARPQGGHAREFVAAVLSQELFHAFARNYCNGTTVLHMSARAFDDYTVPEITPAEAAPFVARIRALNEAEDSCRDEIADLIRTRDELLPLLMSGRIRVADLKGAA